MVVHKTTLHIDTSSQIDAGNSQQQFVCEEMMAVTSYNPLWKYQQSRDLMAHVGEK